MHIGNLGKDLLKGFSGVLVKINTVTRPNPIKLKMQEGTSLNGGKIVDQAKVFGNVKNMLNSIRLNDANQ